MEKNKITGQIYITSLTLMIDGWERTVAIEYVVRNGRPEMVRVRDGKEDVTHLLDYFNRLAVNEKIDQASIHRMNIKEAV